MQEELLQFKIQKVWILVDLPFRKKAIGTKWVYRNKKDGLNERELLSEIKQGLKHIRLFLAFASYMGFIALIQIDVRKCFIMEKMDEELLEPEKDKHVSCGVQVYVDDIIFGLQRNHWCDEFEALRRVDFMRFNRRAHFFLGFTSKRKKMVSLLDSDLCRVNLDKKSTTRGCSISWAGGTHFWQLQKEETIVATLLQSRIMYAAVRVVNHVYHSQKQKQIAIGTLIEMLMRRNYQGGLIGFRESLSRVIDGTEALLIPTLFNSWLDTVIRQCKVTLISLLTTITLTTTMVVLDSCPKHNMVSYLEKSEGNAEFHEIIDFLTRSSIHHALAGKHFSRKVTHLFSSMVVQPTEDEGAPSERPFEAQPTPSPAHSSEDPSPRPSTSTIIPDSIPETSGGNLRGHSSSDKSLSRNEGEMTLQSGRKFAKGEPSVHRDPLFDEIPEDTLDYMETENAQDMGRTSDIVGEEKENDTEDVLSTDKEKVSTDRPIVSTDESKVSTVRQSERYRWQIEAEKKFKQLASDEEMARKIQEEWEGEEERKRLAEEEATNEALIKFMMTKRQELRLTELLAEKLKEEERESEAIRNRLPTKNQLRNQMITYLKHVGNFKHSKLKTKKFEEIQALYEKIKRSDEDFISIGFAEEERLIKKINEKGIDSSKNEMIKEESKEEVKEENKEEESNKKRKLGTRKKMKSRKRRFIQNTFEDDSEKDNDELRLYLTIASDEEKEVDKAEHLEEINQNVVIRSNGQNRYFSTLMRVLSIFDKDDLNAIYQLVMEKYQDEIPEGFDRVICGDLMVMFNPDDEDKFWNSQPDWNIVSWKLHGSLRVHTLVTEAGLVIHMLVEKKYPLRKKVLLQILELKLEYEEDSTMALELIRFVKKLLAELEPEDSNGDEEDL
ncbi:hypothetical protein Tco_0278638 [Tanacetum coccineum]